MSGMEALASALALQAGHNAAVVGVGAALLGFAAGACGAFLFLRKRALVSDAVAHATLPGVVLAFIVMASLGGDGRSLVGLLAGAAVSAALGLLAIEAITARTRLGEDAAIGAVLSTFFGAGVVLLTVVQTMTTGRQAGLEGFLLGATAGMLTQDAVVIAIGGALAVFALWALRRPMTIVAFDADFALSIGLPARWIDRAMMGLAMAVTVIGLTVVGLVLIVALLIIPPVSARFWSDRAETVVWAAGGIGAAAGYLGAALSAAAPDTPTGPTIVLVSAAIFALSFGFAPNRGVIAALARRRRFQFRVHRRQGLLALARGEPIYDGLTLSVLRREGLIRADGVATERGMAEAARIGRDERRWAVARTEHQDAALTGRYDGLTPIETVFTADQIADFDRRIAAGAAP